MFQHSSGGKLAQNANGAYNQSLGTVSLYKYFQGLAEESMMSSSHYPVTKIDTALAALGTVSLRECLQSRVGKLSNLCQVERGFRKT